MPNEPQRRERQMTLWESDGRIVPMKPAVQAGGLKPASVSFTGPVQGRRPSQHEIQTGHRPHSATDDRCYTVRGSEWLFLSSRVRQNAGRPASVVASKNPQSGDCGYVPKLLARGITRLDLITKRAESDQAATFNNLFTLLNYQLLWLAFRKLKRDKAPGIDGVTVDQYEANIRLSRFHALLRHEPRGKIQAEAEDGEKEVQGESTCAKGLVSPPPDDTVVGNVGDAECEASRPLSVLRHQ